MKIQQVAYLYKYDDLRERIDYLKTQQEKTLKPAKPQSASDKSKQVIITQLKERIKKLEAENRGLRDQNEVIYGQFCQLQSVQQQVEALKTQNASLKTENDWLKQQLDQNRSPSQNTIQPAPTSSSRVTPLEKKRSARSPVTEQIQSALADIGIRLNPTLAKTIQAAPESTVLTAISALKEAITTGNIERPGGWLKRAIEECWKPNEPTQQHNEVEQSNAFSEWFDLARSKGLVVASMKEKDGQIHVFDQAGVRYPYEQMFAKHPIESLKD